VESLKYSISLRPTLEAYGNLGAVYFYLRRYAESADVLQQAIKINSNDWLNWGNLGDTLYQIPSRLSEAKAAYQKAIDLAQTRLEVNPRDGYTLAFSADYSAMLDQESKAKEKIARALEVSPKDPEVLFRAAVVFNHFKDETKALSFLGKAVAEGYSRTAIRDTPDFDHFKADPRFRSVVLAVK
jgi:tetratricopeptide (TPR) repeat protein